MKLESLHSLYLKELRNLYHAEKQIAKALPRLVEAVSSPDLRSALSRHLEETRVHASRLEQVFLLHNERPETESCKGVDGILSETKDLVGHDENPGVRDAGIIAGLQKLEHYETAAYGCVRAWAERMGHTNAVDILRQTLDEERATDERLSEISRTLNVEAVRHA